MRRVRMNVAHARVDIDEDDHDDDDYIVSMSIDDRYEE